MRINKQFLNAHYPDNRLDVGIVEVALLYVPKKGWTTILFSDYPEVHKRPPVYDDTKEGALLTASLYLVLGGLKGRLKRLN